MTIPPVNALTCAVCPIPGAAPLGVRRRVSVHRKVAAQRGKDATRRSPTTDPTTTPPSRPVSDWVGHAGGSARRRWFETSAAPAQSAACRSSRSRPRSRRRSRSRSRWRSRSVSRVVLTGRTGSLVATGLPLRDPPGPSPLELRHRGSAKAPFRLLPARPTGCRTLRTAKRARVPQAFGASPSPGCNLDTGPSPRRRTAAHHATIDRHTGSSAAKRRQRRGRHRSWDTMSTPPCGNPAR